MSPTQILIVEDEVIVAEGIRQALARLGYEVPAIVTRGQEAVARAEELRPDLVLMDIRLQGEMDGIETAGEIRARLDIPIVYLTAHDDEATLARAKLTEPAGYLIKPFAANTLHSTLEMALYKHQTETRLRESEARYRSLFDRVPVGLYRSTPQGQFLDVNPALVHMLGYPDRDALLGTNAADLYETAGERQRWQERLEREGEVRGFEMRYRRHDGTIVWLNENARVARDAGGEALYYEGTLEDITERKEAEEAYRTLVENSLQGLVILQDGLAVFANPALADISGYTIDQLLSLAPEEVGAIIHPDDRALVLQRLSVRTAGTEIPQRQEFRFLRQDGAVRWVEAFAARIDYRGRPAIQIAFIDITERKQAGEALQESQKNLSLAQEVAHIGAWKYNLKTEGLYWSDELYRIYGLDPESTEPSLDFGLDLIHPDDQEFADEALRNALLEGLPYEIEYRVIRPDGQERFLRGIGRIETDEKGDVLGAYGTNQDITERKRTEKVVEAIHEGTARATGAEFFRELVRRLGEFLDVRYAFVARLLAEDEVRTVAVWAEGDFGENFQYSLDGTPCRDVARRGACFYPSRIQAHFPTNHLLVEMGVESYMGTPLRDADGKTIGLLVVMDDHPMEDVPLFRHVLEVFAARAGAELGRREAEEALRRRQEQLEALRQVGLEITAQLDLDAVLHSIVSRAVELLTAKSGGFFLCRPEQNLLEWVAAIGPDLPPEGRTLSKGQGLSGRVWETGEPLIVDDYQHWPGRDEDFAKYAITAAIGVPVRWGDELLGVLDVQADSPRTFSTEDTELLTLLAAQASIAIKNAQLFQAEQQRRRETETLRQASLVFGSTLDTDRILEKLLDQIGAVIPYDSANVMCIEDGMIRITHQRGYERMGTSEAVAALTFSIAETAILNRMASTRRPHIVPDTRADPEWVDLDTTRWIRSWAGAPITTRDDVLGFFSLDSGMPNFYTPEHMDLLAAFAAHASMAIENARLFTETQVAYRELKQTQAQLVQSAKLAAIGELAAGVAHEINNPLTSILGFAEVIAWQLAPDDPNRQDLEIIAAEAKRAGDIVRNLLEFARQTKPLTEPADINHVLRQTLALIRSHVEKDGVTVEEQYASGLDQIPLDAGQMKQVFLNLITNAAHAMPDRGTLTVSTAQVKDRVAVRFADTGVGIPPPDLERIFEPFFTTKSSGTGLGLSVSLGIVQQHGGRIEVESQVGEGSTFTVWLPAGGES